MSRHFHLCNYDGGWTPDGSFAEADAADQDSRPADDADLEDEAFSSWMEEEFLCRRSCPYCGTILKRAIYESQDDPDYEPSSDPESHSELINLPGRVSDGCLLRPDMAELSVCDFCAYWQGSHLSYGRGVWGRAAASVLATFDPDLPEGCWSELAQHLRRNQQRWTDLSPERMERLVVEVLRANFDGAAEAMHVGRPGDGGIDGVLTLTNGNRCLIQAKRRKSNNAVEGVELVRCLVGTLVDEGSVRGVIASNADHFSTQAKRYAERVRQKGYYIELVDRGKLVTLLEPFMPERSWERFFEDELDARLARAFSSKIQQYANESRRPRQLSLFELIRGGQKP